MICPNIPRASPARTRRTSPDRPLSGDREPDLAGTLALAQVISSRCLQTPQTLHKPRINRVSAWQNFAVGLILGVLAGCSAPLPIERFSQSDPAFDPVRFWTGHVRSWGVVENRSGQPVDIVETDCIGNPDGLDGLRMTQLLIYGDSRRVREWRMRRLGDGRYEAAASDMVGAGIGSASGRAFHWSWILATKPGDSLFDVTLEQWMYLQSSGTLMVRTTVTKLGIILAEVTEQFERVP
jgi:hypothetical protein